MHKDGLHLDEKLGKSSDQLEQNLQTCAQSLQQFEAKFRPFHHSPIGSGLELLTLLRVVLSDDVTILHKQKFTPDTM